MTATTSSEQPGPDPQSTHRDPANQPERPGTIPWELLGARDYRAALTDLGSWLAWLVPTYRIPPSVIPPCWFLHPGLIEELGHLWTGWRVTQHPDTGVGMIGLDWDGHRERATGRLRELVATAGCNGTTHSPKPGPALSRDDGLWKAAIHDETAVRTERSAQAVVRAAAQEVLLKAEERNESALEILCEVADDPRHPTASEMGQAAAALQNMTRMATAVAQRRGPEARMHVDKAGRQVHLEGELAAARADLLACVVVSQNAAGLDAATKRWTDAVNWALPAEDAVRRAAAAFVGKSAAAGHPTSAAFRHPLVADRLALSSIRTQSANGAKGTK